MYKLKSKAAEGYRSAGGDNLVLEHGVSYDLNAQQIEALGDVVEPVKPKPRGQQKAGK